MSIAGASTFHRACDIVAPRGGAYTTNYNVTAAAPGRAISAGWVGGFGNTVRVEHEDG